MAKPKKTNKPWYKLKASAEKVTLILYGYIGEWDESAEQWRSELLAHGTKDLFVHFQTYGGEVDEGMGIYAAFKDYQGHITGVVDTVCASIGSQALMGCDTRLIRPTARLMIHQCEGWASGKAAEMRARADEAEIINDQMMTTFAEVSGKPKETIIEDTKDADLWLSAEQAIEYGLCDEIYEGSTDLLQACSDSIDDIETHSSKGLRQRNALKAALEHGEAHQPPGDTAADDPTSGALPQPAQNPKLEAGTKDMTLEEYQALEKARKDGLKALFKGHPKHKVLFAACMDDPEITVDDARMKLVAACAEATPLVKVDDTPTPPVSSQTALTADASKNHLQNLVHGKLKACAVTEDNPYRHMSTPEALRAHAMASGDATALGLNNRQLVAHAFNNNTHSLPNILETGIQILIENETANLEHWHLPLVKRQPMRFGTNDILQSQDIGKPGVKTEGGKFKKVVLKATGDTAVLATQGFEIEVTRELVMSDKYDYIASQVEKAVRECQQVPARLLLKALQQNDKLADGKNLFTTAAGEKNLYTLPLIASTLAEMSGDMADAKTGQGNPLYLKPDTVLVSNKQGKKAKALISAETLKEEPNEAFEAFDKVQGLADLAGTDTLYTFANKDHVSIIEGYHEDADGVQVETKEEWKSDGAVVRVFVDSCIKIVSRKGLQKLSISA